MLTVMRRFPQIRKVSFGYYEYVMSDEEREKQSSLIESLNEDF